MAGIQPEGQSLQRAIRYVSDRLLEDADQPLMPLVQDASVRFDLTPKDSEFLVRFYREAAERTS